MPSPTYVAIAKNVLTTSQSSITFSAIANTYTDLVVLVSARQTGTGGAFVGTAKVEFNGTTTNHSYRELFSSGTTAGSTSNTSNAFMLRYSADGCTANTFGTCELYIPNYAGSTNKPMSATSVDENNTTTDGQSRIAADAGLWSNTAAITSITITPTSGSIDAGSRFDLYGIKNS